MRLPAAIPAEFITRLFLAMIYVDRKRIQRPKWFGGPEWGKMQLHLMEHVAESVETRAQRRLEDMFSTFKPHLHEVMRMFDGRCAFCERSVRTEDITTLKRFRPVETERAQNRYVHAYAALLWENLVLMCEECAQAWGNRFPVGGKEGPDETILKEVRQILKGGSAMEAYVQLEEVLAGMHAQERPLLLDPTRDQPAHFLQITEDGLVNAFELDPIRQQRGSLTIEMFGLNRQPLVRSREMVMRSTKKDLAGVRLPETSSDPLMSAKTLSNEVVGQILRPQAHTYRMVKASAVARWMKLWMKVSLAEILPHVAMGDAPALAQFRNSVQPAYEALNNILPPDPWQPVEAPRTRARVLDLISPPKRLARAKEREFSHKWVRSVKLLNYRQFKEAVFHLRGFDRENKMEAPEREEELHHLVDQIREAYFEKQKKVEDQVGPTSAAAPFLKSDVPGLAAVDRLALLESSGLGFVGKEKQCGWKMLLGENGVGKSSVLQAIALALRADEAGSKLVAQELAYEFADLHVSVGSEGDTGVIEVEIEGRAMPIRLEFSAKRISVAGAAADTYEPSPSGLLREVLYLRGYGATRLLPRRAANGAASHGAEVKTDSEFEKVSAQEVRNLFDAYHPLVDPELWLASLDDKLRHEAFKALKELLGLPLNSNLHLKMRGPQQRPVLELLRQKDKDPGKGYWPPVPLAHFSAGYQTMVALCCDLMAGFLERQMSNMEITGVVLLDEIGTNLHPRWRLGVVGALRRTFPMLQFIASTHEPLCLRGLREGEVCLLALDSTSHQVSLRDDLPSPALYRVDQLLTSDFFGLRSAYDPVEEEAFDWYHKFLVQDSTAPLPPVQRKQLDKLRFLLKDRLVPGSTAPERQMMEALELAMRLRQEKPTLIGSAGAKQAAEDLLARISVNISVPRNSTAATAT